MPVLNGDLTFSMLIFAGLALWMVGVPAGLVLERTCQGIGFPVLRGRAAPVAAAGMLLVAPFFVTASAQDSCTPIGYTCQGGAETRIVDGFEYTPSSCWNRTALLNCERNPPFDSCVALEAAPTCVELSTTCVDIREGECARFEKRFSCQNADVDETDLTIIDASYSITRDEQVSQCGPLEAEQNCVYQGEVCSEGPETRIINGMPVTKQCWATERTYSCAAETETSDCAELEGDQSCVPLDEVCLNELPDGTCGHRERNFKCGGTPALFDPTGGDASCGAVEVCVGGDCRTYEDEPNKDFGKAAAYLNMLDAIAKDFEDFEIFTGEDQRCRKWPLGLLNCCSDSGLILDVLNICNETEHRLRDAVNAETVHYIGTYCSEKALFVCLEKKRVYCTFNSKFGRVVHQQGRPQLGIPWNFNDKASQPNCRGFTPEELEAIDFEQVDLSELYDDMIAKAEVPDYGELSSRMQQDISAFTEGGIRPDPDGDDVEGDGGEVAEITYERRTRQCQVGLSGEIVEERDIAVDSFGGQTPLTDWRVISDTCLPIQTDERVSACGGDWLGEIREEQLFTIDLEGVRTNLGPWETVEDACFMLAVENRTRQCEPPASGSFEEERDIRDFRARPDEVLSDWTRTSGGCFSIETESRPLACPATFTGSRTEERTYRLWDDGSITDYSSWLLATDDCRKQQTETRSAACDAGWSGNRTESRTYDLRPDGTRENYSAWAVSANACYIPRTENRTVACASGYSGTHAQSRTYRDNQVGPHSNYSAWTTTSITCSRSSYDTRNAACPAPWTAGGALAQRRNWTQIQGGAKTFTSGWYTVADSCSRIYLQFQDQSCPASGFRRYSRQVRDFRDGRPDQVLTGWVFHSNHNCQTTGQ